MMKTTEEKAKAYDEAFEKAKSLYATPCDIDKVGVIKETLDYLFPELAESEDEKIRKEILEYITKATGCKSWIAWLEKQGEPKPICPNGFSSIDPHFLKKSEEAGYSDEDIKNKLEE